MLNRIKGILPAIVYCFLTILLLTPFNAKAAQGGVQYDTSTRVVVPTNLVIKATSFAGNGAALTGITNVEVKGVAQGTNILITTNNGVVTINGTIVPITVAQGTNIILVTNNGVVTIHSTASGTGSGNNFDANFVTNDNKISLAGDITISNVTLTGTMSLDTLSAGTVALSNQLDVVIGGTGLTNVPVGSLLVGNGTNALNLFTFYTNGTLILATNINFVGTAITNVNGDVSIGLGASTSGGNNFDTLNFGTNGSSKIALLSTLTVTNLITLDTLYANNAVITNMTIMTQSVDTATITNFNVTTQNIGTANITNFNVITQTVGTLTVTQLNIGSLEVTNATGTNSLGTTIISDLIATNATINGKLIYKSYIVNPDYEGTNFVIDLNKPYVSYYATNNINLAYITNLFSGDGMTAVTFTIVTNGTTPILTFPASWIPYGVNTINNMVVTNRTKVMIEYSTNSVDLSTNIIIITRN